MPGVKRWLHTSHRSAELLLHKERCANKERKMSKTYEEALLPPDCISAHLHCNQDELFQNLLAGSAISVHHCKGTSSSHGLGEYCWHLMTHHITRAQQPGQGCHTNGGMLGTSCGVIPHSLTQFSAADFCLCKKVKPTCNFVLLKDELNSNRIKQVFPCHV